MRICLFVRVGWISRQRKDVAALVAAMAVLGLLAPGTARALTPSDPEFSFQWADENTGQAIPGQVPARGTPFADDSAADAWSVTTGDPSIVIGEIDTGVDYEHPDLKANIWSNPEGKGGCLPGTHGFNVLKPVETLESCQPIDEDATYAGHGTHVAGIMGAVGNNGMGVAGMNWHTTIVPVKWLDDAGEEPKERAAETLREALVWLVRLKHEGVNVRVVNDSATFAGTKKSAALENEIKVLGENQILFVTAAGNLGKNDDENPRYPCNHELELPNEICVTATNGKDELPTWANFGPHAVDLAAPGSSIYSTLRQKGTEPNGETNFGYVTGTSMAAAEVSGAAALILSREPWLTAVELRNAILEHVDKLPSLQGKVKTGGRLDVCEAIPGCFDPLSPPAIAVQPPTPPVSSPPAPVPPLIGALKIAPSAFKAAKSGPVIHPGLLHSGATVSYTDSEPATTEFTVQVPRTGVLNAAKKCVAPPRHPHGRPAKRCLRWLSAGKFKRTDSAGQNSFRFSAHVGRSGLAVGRYRLLAAPTFEGRSGARALVGFRIVR
jgi:hypothetical protein